MKKGKRLFERTVGGIFLSAAIILTQISIPQVQASTSSDFRMDGDKLVKYAGTANTVSVPDSVKIIGAEAFADCSFLTGVTIKSGVVEIEYGAFADCKQLRRVDIPSTVTKIGREAFSNCEQLNTVILGKEVKEVEPGAFAGCNSLKNITVKSDNPYLSSSNGVLYNKDKTKIFVMCAGSEKTKYNMPSTVETIDPYAFWKCENLKEIVFSGNMKEIPAYSFSNCSGLEAVSIPYSVKQIDMKAFENCTSLTNADIPPSVGYIHLTAFDGCNKLNIKAEAGTVAETFAKTFDEKKESVSENEANKNNGDAEIDKKEVDTTKPDNKVIVEVENENVLGKTIIVSGQAVVLMQQGTQKVYNTKEDNLVEQQSEQAQTVTEPQAVIAERTFYRNADFTEYTIPEGIKSIEAFSFARSGLKHIEIPEGVEKIDYAAFYHCDSLQTITIPNTVQSIGAQAFGKTPWMNQWIENATEEFLVVGDGILIAYKGKQEEVSIPQGVKKIAAEAFADHEEIKKVLIPAETVEIGDNAFAGCINLREIAGGENVKLMSGSAFTDCPVQISEIVKSNKENLKGAVIGNYQILQKDEGLIAKNATIVFLKWFFIISLSLTGIILLFYKGNRKKLSA